LTTVKRVYRKSYGQTLLYTLGTQDMKWLYSIAGHTYILHGCRVCYIFNCTSTHSTQVQLAWLWKQRD